MCWFCPFLFLTTSKYNVFIDVELSSAMTEPGIIDPTGAETFAKEPKLAKLFREIMSMPVRHHKKTPLVFLVCQ